MQRYISSLVIGLLLALPLSVEAAPSCPVDTLVMGQDSALYDGLQGNPGMSDESDDGSPNDGLSDADLQNPGLGQDDNNGLTDEDQSGESHFIDFIDGLEYAASRNSIEEVLIYYRTFNNTTWQALYVPFSIPVDTLTKYGMQVAELNDTHMYDRDDDGTFEEVTVEFLRMISGSTEANYPYLIKAQEAGEKSFTLKDVELKAAAENSIDCSTVKQKFTFTGTYTGVSGEDMFSNNYYAMSGGGLSRVNGPTVSLKPQRWYMSIENRDGSSPDYYAPQMRLVVDGVWEEVTGLSNICHNANEAVLYDLQGRRVNGTTVRSGLYVQDGKKVVVK